MVSFSRLSLLLLFSHATSPVVFAQRKYAVYYDPADEPNRNPKGSGFQPVGPNNWDEVVSIK